MGEPMHESTWENSISAIRTRKGPFCERSHITDYADLGEELEGREDAEAGGDDP